MYRRILTTLAEIAGITAADAGVWHRFGWDYALILAGVALVAIGVTQA